MFDSWGIWAIIDEVKFILGDIMLGYPFNMVLHAEEWGQPWRGSTAWHNKYYIKAFQIWLSLLKSNYAPIVDNYLPIAH